VLLIVYLVFHEEWTSHTAMSFSNSIRMLFGMKFPGIIDMTLVVPKV